MFLALTAQPEYWNKQEKILFLGTWCLRQDRPQDWSGLDFEILETPWNDRRLFYSAAEYVDNLGERVLEVLSPVLNDLHGVKFSKRYWRIVLGYWLLHLLHSAYDRYVHIRAAVEYAPDFTTQLIIDDGSTPRDMTKFIDMIIGDEGNMLLISYLLRAMGRRDPEATALPTKTAIIPQGSGWKRMLSRAAPSLIGKTADFYTVLSSGRNQPAITEIGIGRRDLNKLLSVGRLRPLRLRAPNLTTAACPKMRHALKEGLDASIQFNNATEFEKFLPGLVARFMPTIGLESYSVVRAAVGTVRRYPPCIVSAVGWAFNESFKFYAAEAAEHGTSLIAIQHGGGYGQYLFSAPERHETRISDRYLVWGWAGQDPAHLVNIPHPKVTPRWKSRKKSLEGSVLFVPTEHTRYLYRFHSQVVGCQWPAYFEAQKRFLGALGREGRRGLVFRSPFYASQLGHGQYEIIHPAFPDIAWDDGRPIEAWFDSARLFIIDHLGTAILETLGQNIPTIVFWNPAHCELRSAAQPFFDELRAARILWDSPEGAASHARQVWHDPMSWWLSPTVQNARRAFTEVFALGDMNWASVWTARLQDLARDKTALCV